MNFFNLFRHDKTIKIFDKQLYAGDSINICGLPYTGRTTLCFYIIKMNKEKIFLYISPEGISEYYQKKLNELSSNVYLSFTNNLEYINLYLETLLCDVIIIDTFTALQYISNKKDIEKFFELIHKKKINAILTTNLVNINGRELYEHKKILNFFSYVINIEKKDDYIFLNNRYKIPLKEIWY